MWIFCLCVIESRLVLLSSLAQVKTLPVGLTPKPYTRDDDGTTIKDIEADVRISSPSFSINLKMVTSLLNEAEKTGTNGMVRRNASVF